MVKTLNRSDGFIIGGILLSVFSYAFGAWLGSQSGLAILLDLGNFLNNADPAQDVSRQQSIFLLLLALFILTAGQLITFVAFWLTGRTRWHIMRAVMTILAIGGLLYLYSAYEAQTSGVILMIAGNAAILAGSLYPVYRLSDSVEPTDEYVIVKAAPVVEDAKLSPVEPVPQEDPMIAFQRKTAREFHRSQQDGKTFGLAIVSVTGFEDYKVVFGDEAATEMVDALKSYIADCDNVSQSVGFSKGAVMASLPDCEIAEVEASVRNVERKMQTHGFIGEMLLPSGKLTLKWATALSQVDGDDLASLTEHVLMRFSEASSI